MSAWPVVLRFVLLCGLYESADLSPDVCAWVAMPAWLVVLVCGLYEYADLNPDVCAWVAMSVSAWPVVRITLLLNLARLFGLDPMLVCCPDVCAWEAMKMSAWPVRPGLALVCCPDGCAMAVLGPWNGCMSLVL